MKIGILVTGHVSSDLVDEFGEYPAMFADLFRRIDPSLTFQDWSVVDGEFPDDPSACDAWLLTGSKHGVYDPEPWIEPLKDFLLAAREVRIPMIGICFGHQIMAEAFGGRAEKSSRGWGVGVHEYAITERPGWLRPDSSDFGMYAMHQDQVTQLPPDGVVLASSAFCPIAMASYGDPEAPDAISIQPHPEFFHDYALALINLRDDLVGVERAAEARKGIANPVASDDFVRWTLSYLDTVSTQRRAA